MIQATAGRYRWSVFSNDRRGATSIEFAVGALVMAMMLFGIVEWGRLLWTRQIIMHVSDMTARCYSISSPQCSGTSTPASYAVSLAAADGLTISASNVTTGSAPTCTSQTGGNLQYYAISITYNFVSPVTALLSLPASVTVSSQYGC
jgi:Flp pilus assembly protein TadG